MMSDDHASVARSFAASFERRLKRKELGNSTIQATAPAGIAEAAGGAPTRAGTDLLRSDLPIEQWMTDAEEKAALSGRFSPAELFDDSIDDGARRLILTRLSMECTVDASGPDVYWTMLQDPRISILKRLQNEGQLEVKAAGADLPTADAYGGHLRKVLQHGDSPDVEEHTLEQLLPLASALETVAALGPVPPKQLPLVRTLVGKQSIIEDYDTLLQNGIYGRDSNLNDLKRFLLAAGARRPSKLTGWDSRLLTGLGGSGKSTILAKFLRDVMEQNLATVAVLDFDRPGIDPEDTVWLEFEITRQVGYQVPEIDQALRLSRERARSQRQSGDSDAPTPESSADTRGHRGILQEMQALLIDAGAATRPFLLVLDTFEEVTDRELTNKVIEWLRDLALALDGLVLKIIFSGRLFEAALAQLSGAVAESEPIGELDPAATRQLLLSQNVREDTAQRLASSQVLPLRPLELKFMAKVIGGGSPAEVVALEEDVRTGGPRAKELFTSIVYRRVLRRIKDKTAKALAHPGLVLRFVSSDLICEVLAPVLGLPGMNKDTAPEALRSLARHNWLTYRGTDGSLWHRKDLRRSMLAAMTAEEAKLAERIHEKAAVFFEKSDDPRLLAEATYNRLMLVRQPEQGAALDLERIRAARGVIGADAVDLPPAGAALFKFATRSRVPDSDLWLLPTKHVGRAYSEVGNRLTRQREFGLAARLILQRQKEMRPEERSLERWEIATLFATVNWADLNKLLNARRQDNSKGLLKGLTAQASIASALFPYVLTAPKLPDDFWPVALAAIAGLSQSPIGALTRFFYSLGVAQPSLNQLAMSLVLIDKKELRKRRNRLILRDFVNLLRGKANRSATDYRTLWLAALAHMKDDFDLTLTAGMMRLDQKWLETARQQALESRSDGRAVTLIAAMMDAIGRTMGSRSLTARRLLSNIDAAAKKVGDKATLTITLPPLDPEQLFQLCRGPDPEFRDPVRYALLEAFPDRASHLQLAPIIREHLSFDLEDLAPDAFADIVGQDPEHALDLYVELVDRAWVLGPVLASARRVRPAAAKLGLVADAYDRWNGAVHRAAHQP